jgi:hypothetical protein
MTWTYFPLVASTVAGVALIFATLGIFLWISSLAKRDIHFDEIAPLTGKLVVKGKDVVKVQFNPQKTLSDPTKIVGHYGKDGEWVAKPGSLGLCFDITGRAFYGLYPIYEIMKFHVSWSDYAGGEEKDGKRIPPSIIPRTIHCDSFNRFYTHAVLFHGVEMAHEGEGDDTSTTKIDAAILVTIEITNIINAVFKLEPEGIVFLQADTAIKAAFNDYLKGRKWNDFKNETKGSQDSPFVKHMIDHTNAALKILGIGMKLTIVELRYHDLTPSPGNEELERSQTQVLIEENLGDAAIARETRLARAAEIRGQGKAAELKAVVAVVDKDGAVQLESLTRIADTNLRVYGEPTKTVPVVNVGDGEEGKK